MKLRIVSIILRQLMWPKICLFRVISTARQEGKPHLWQPLLTWGAGSIQFERDVAIGYFPSPFFFSSYAHIEARTRNARVVIGEGTHINNNFVAIAEHTSIRIGKRCFIGTNVEILDSDFHGIRVSERGRSNPEFARPVVIGDDVFIGSNTKILKGAEIGSKSVIGSGSIVIGAIPAGVVAAGVPARPLTVIPA